MRLEPDGLLGAIIASESIGITDTVVNGSGGCRSRSQIMLHELITDYEPENEKCCGSKYFSRQSRLPCTYLNSDDLVFGTGGKVAEGLKSVFEATGRRAVLLDTLGASLLCTEYKASEGCPEPIVIDADLSSLSFHRGFDIATETILSSVEFDRGENGTVNLLGYSITDPGWQAGIANLKHLLSLMGVEAAAPNCRPTVAEAKRMGGASLNVMVRPESCRKTAEMMERRYGIPSLRPAMGAPVGYKATRSFVTEIAEALGISPDGALREIDREERAVHAVLMNFDRAPMGLHAKGLEIDAESSTVWPLLRWMHETFLMAPKRIHAVDSEYSTEIARYLDDIGFPGSVEGPEGEADFVFSDGMTALAGRVNPGMKSCVEVRMPRSRNLDLLGRCVVGTAGCRYLLDELFNGLVRFRCGQPTEIDMRPGCCRN